MPIDLYGRGAERRRIGEQDGQDNSENQRHDVRHV